MVPSKSTMTAKVQFRRPCRLNSDERLPRRQNDCSCLIYTYQMIVEPSTTPLWPSIPHGSGAFGPNKVASAVDS